MKLPDLPKRKPREPKAAMAGRGFKAPAFLEDLYKDMRDRRLIIPAIALLVAIFAVPLLLSESPDTSVTAAPLAEDPNAVRVEPAVLAVQEVGVRDFRERLDALKRKNPFGGRFDPKEPSSAETAGELVDPEGGGTGTAGASAAAPAETTPPSSSPTGPTTPTEPSEPTEPPEPFVLVPRVDVEVGVVDNERRENVENVKPGDLLPSKDIPAAMYLGNTDDGKASEFLVSRDVEKVGGEGECRPDSDSCEFLRLEEGDAGYLKFANGKRYVIKVTKIYFERVDQDEFDQND